MARYDERTALLVVDVQNDFADPAGSLYVRDGELVVPVITQEIARAQASHAYVVYSQDWHPASTPHFLKDGGIWPVHCVQGSWGAELHPDLAVVGPVVQKGVYGEDGYSAFSMRDPRSGSMSVTRLDDELKTHGIGRLVVCGLATDYCVVETVLDAKNRGYAVEVLSAGIRAVELEPGDGERAIARMGAARADIE
jgi:nicotinamidase/pyrazinamidase